jgi:hypothetical protein
MGTVDNKKRNYPKLYNKADPIITGEKLIQHNSSLEKVWN